MIICPFTHAFFDYGGVIAEEGFKLTLMDMARAYGRDPQELWRTGLESVWDSGYIVARAGEADFWAMFKARSGLQGDQSVWRSRMLDAFVVRPFMLDVVGRLRGRGMRLAVLSDQTDWLERLDAVQGFSGHFDKVFNSYRYGLTKQDPRYFQIALKEMGARPEASLFVDDNPGNVERAEELGFTAILYETREGFEDDLRAVCPEIFQQSESPA